MTTYTPPAGNAVSLNFTHAYTAPLGGAVAFNFTNVSAYTFVADPGSYALIGAAVSLKVARLLRAFNDLVVNGTFPVDTSGWTVNGSDTVFAAAAGEGVLTLGPAAAGGYAWQAISVVPGKPYTLAGLLRSTKTYSMSASPGTYALTGTDVTLTYDQAPVELGGPWTISGPKHRAAFTVNYGGAIITANDSSSVIARYWTSTGYSAYEVMAHITSGTTPTSLDAFDTWFDLAIGPGPNWGYEYNTGAAQACQFTVTIRRKSDLVVMDTATVSLSASGGP